jgi:hypothetical protein
MALNRAFSCHSIDDQPDYSGRDTGFGDRTCRVAVNLKQATGKMAV